MCIEQKMQGQLGAQLVGERMILPVFLINGEVLIEADTGQFRDPLEIIIAVRIAMFEKLEIFILHASQYSRWDGGLLHLE